MIYIDPGERRADTMTIVNEHCAVRNANTGEFQLVAKACGYLELVLRNLAEFYEAGVIDTPCGSDPDGWQELAWTKTGHYLWKQWREGPPRAVVELPVPVIAPIGDIPVVARQMLADAGWTVLNIWKVTGGWIAGVGRDREDGGYTESVLFLDQRGIAFAEMTREEAAAYGAAILAAAR